MTAVHIPPALRSYTRLARVQADGVTLDELFVSLERQFPGLRFRVVDEQDRIRRHIQFFVGAKAARDLAHPVDADDEVRIVAALSGG